MLTPDQVRVKQLLSETITLLCKNGLHFRSEFCINALIGITLDQQDVFLVSINETVHSGETFVRNRATPAGGGGGGVLQSPPHSARLRNDRPEHRYADFKVGHGADYRSGHADLRSGSHWDTRQGRGEFRSSHGESRSGDLRGLSADARSSRAESRSSQVESRAGQVEHSSDRTDSWPELSKYKSDRVDRDLDHIGSEVIESRPTLPESGSSVAEIQSENGCDRGAERRSEAERGEGMVSHVGRERVLEGSRTEECERGNEETTAATENKTGVDSENIVAGGVGRGVEGSVAVKAEKFQGERSEADKSSGEQTPQGDKASPIARTCNSLTSQGDLNPAHSDSDTSADCAPLPLTKLTPSAANRTSRTNDLSDWPLERCRNSESERCGSSQGSEGNGSRGNNGLGELSGRGGGRGREESDEEGLLFVKEEPPCYSDDEFQHGGGAGGDVTPRRYSNHRPGLSLGRPLGLGEYSPVIGYSMYGGGLIASSQSHHQMAAKRSYDLSRSLIGLGGGPMGGGGLKMPTYGAASSVNDGYQPKTLRYDDSIYDSRDSSLSGVGGVGPAGGGGDEGGAVRGVGGGAREWSSRRQRATFSAHQVERLERMFVRSRYVGTAERTELSRELGINENIIQVWFQNRRQKLKKQMTARTGGEGGGGGGDEEGPSGRGEGYTHPPLSADGASFSAGEGKLGLDRLGGYHDRFNVGGTTPRAAGGPGGSQTPDLSAAALRFSFGGQDSNVLRGLNGDYTD